MYDARILAMCAGDQASTFRAAPRANADW